MPASNKRYRIQHRTTKKFSMGGSRPRWSSRTGKIWTERSLKSHLTIAVPSLLHSSGDNPYAEADIVEYELVETQVRIDVHEFYDRCGRK